MEQLILSALARKNYVPVKPKVLARQAGVPHSQYAEFRRVLRDLAKQGRITFGRNHSVHAAGRDAAAALVGVFRRTSSGRGYVMPLTGGPEIAVSAVRAEDAATGDEVSIRVVRKASGDRPAVGEILGVVKRATHQFVGTYHERDGEA